MLHVSIFQKDLGENLNLTTFKKLASLKSDFLLLPEYYYTDPRIKKYEEIIQRGSEIQVYIQKLSKTYKGAIIGGTFLYTQNNKQYLGIPIISRGAIVDWYDKQILSKEERRLANTKENDGIYVLSRSRFAIRAYSDLENKRSMDLLFEQNIKLVFLFGNFLCAAKDPRKSKHISKLTGELNANVVLCSGVGENYQGKFIGRSMTTTPHGVSWRVAEAEANEQLLKTVMVSHNPEPPSTEDTDPSSGEESHPK